MASATLDRMPAPILVVDNAHLRELVAQHAHDANLNHLDVSQIQDFSGIFEESGFVGDISKWDTAQATSMAKMFRKSAFQGDVSQWDVANLEDMESMFEYSPFSGDISGWDVSKV